MVLTMESIPIAADEWIVAQGLVGYYRLLKHAGIKVKLTDEGLLFDPEHLENFEHHYFQFFLDRYSVAKRDERTIRREFAKLKQASKLDGKEAKGKIQMAKKTLDERIKLTALDKVEKKFTETAATNRLVKAAKAIRNQKAYTAEMDEWIEEYITALEEQEIDHKLTLNYVKAKVLGAYFGQVSFLNVLQTAKTLEEQKTIFRKEYIEPLLLDLELRKVMLEATSAQEVLQYLESSVHGKAKDLKKKFKNMNIDEIRECISTKVNRCSFFKTQWAFEQYSESHFSPLSMSAPKALNFYWGANNTLTTPISKLAKLILFCAPAGASIVGETSLFVQLEGRFEQLIRANDVYEIGRSKEKAFDEILFDLVAEQRTKAQQVSQSYLILEYSSDYNAKKTDLQYLHLTPGLCNLFNSDIYQRWFLQLNYRLRNQLVRSFLLYQDPKALIQSHLRMKLKENYIGNDMVYACLLRHYFLLYTKKGEKIMATDLEIGRKRIWNAYYAGLDMKKKLDEGKARSIAYRLLNAVRANDKNMFLDTTMRMYMSLQEALPPVIMNVLDESKIDFPSVADSFIAGLISTEEEKNEK
ncbi:type I-B CRISPR-associated protein Cas8b1/Cst1 [Aneurinibacillus aneurinilyticus]|uniref:type I-B CRISPR-associated protein Cas8b1/Cst1 n=1 Tax=Aneurinibacillus aneurinilyticus TaxID=1391 RepID=UPI0035260A58